MRGFLEAASWPCIGAQVKYGSHVVIWTACKRMHNQYETSSGFFRIVPDYQYLT